jgi:hypothetical protein
VSSTRPTGGHAEDAALALYVDRLDRQLALLRELATLSAVQHAAARDGDAEALGSATASREGVVRELLDLDRDIEPARARFLPQDLDHTSPESAEPIVARHQEVRALVDVILDTDQSTLRALERTEASRRSAAQVIEAGEATLAAYRKVVAPPPTAAGLVDRRG